MKKCILSIVLTVGMSLFWGCSRNDETAHPKSKEKSKSMSKNQSSSEPLPIVPRSITASVSFPEYEKGGIVDLTSMGDLDWICLTCDNNKIMPFSSKKGGDYIGNILGKSARSPATGFACVDGGFNDGEPFSNVDASFSSGYSWLFKDIKDSSIEFPLALDDKSKVVQLFGYSKGTGCGIKVLDRTSKKITQVDIPLDKDEGKSWIAKLDVDASTGAQIRVILTFLDNKDESTFSSMALGAVVVSSKSADLQYKKK
jgi:hypothetical protein